MYNPKTSWSNKNGQATISARVNSILHLGDADKSGGDVTHVNLSTRPAVPVLYALQTPKHIRGWSHYTDTSEPVVGYGANKVVIVQSMIQISDLLTTSPT
jgi:hypothetical protein